MTRQEKQYARELADAIGLGAHEDVPLALIATIARQQLEAADAQQALDRAAIAFAHERCDLTLRRQHVRRRRCVPNPAESAAW